jgi:hypothetical protein
MSSTSAAVTASSSTDATHLREPSTRDVDVADEVRHVQARPRTSRTTTRRPRQGGQRATAANQRRATVVGGTGKKAPATTNSKTRKRVAVGAAKKPAVRSSRARRKTPETPADREHEFRMVGAAHISIVAKILSMCIGETVAGIHASLDPVRSERDELKTILQTLERRSGCPNHRVGYRT